MLNSRKILLKFVTTLYLFALLVSAAGCSTDNSAESSEQIMLFDNRVSFVPPDGFKLMKEEQLKKKLPEYNPPRHIFANQSQSAFVLIFVNEEIEFEPGYLVEKKGFDERNNIKVPGSITSEIIKMNGRQWFHFEWEISTPDDTLVAPVPRETDAAPEIWDEKTVRSRAYTTVFDRKLLSFVFQAKVKEYPQVKDIFSKSIRSIRVRD